MKHNTTLTDLSGLQNGSDIRGVALEGIKGEAVNLNQAVARRLGRGFALWLSRQDSDGQSANFKVAVGRDSRLSGPALSRAFSEGLISMGIEVLDLGLATTPAMFMSTQDKSRGVMAGVMLTASHLPFNRNGMKFFTRRGGLDKANIKEILALAGSKEPEKGQMGEGSIRSDSFMGTYADFLVSSIRKGAADPDNYKEPLRGMKILVDAGNGAGGFFASQVLQPLGADTSGSQFLEPDGTFPNHIPNPEDNEAMASISRAVTDQGADLGIIFDTDVDRSALVNRKGRALNRNRLIALVSAIVLEEHPGSTIVTDSITSTGLGEFIRGQGGKHHRFRRGYKNVINESLRLNTEGEESWLAIETSGHAALKENYFLDDGAFLVAKLLIHAARLKRKGLDLDEEISELNEVAFSLEYRLRILEKDFITYGEKVLEGLEKRIGSESLWLREHPDHEGIRANYLPGKAWFLLRLSLHDPVMVLNLEADSEKVIGEMLHWLREYLGCFPQLNHSSLKD